MPSTPSGSGRDRSSAVRTVSRCMARTPATAGSTPGWSGTAISSSTPSGSGTAGGAAPPVGAGSPVCAGAVGGSVWARRASTGPPVRNASTASRSCSAVGAPASGSAGGSPARTADTRLTRSATREPRQEDQAAGPVASASASVRACSSSRVPSVPTASATVRTVTGSSRSRRVAVSTSSRWCRTRVARTAVSARSKPMRAATSRTMVSPATEWSPGHPLPMSCSSAATRSRSGRWTRRAKPAARTAVSMRWRSTVHTCTALRCGRQRTRSQSGSSRVTSPSASSASQTCTVGRPDPSRVTNCSRASAGQGVGSGPAPAARRRTAYRESGRPAWAAAAAARSGRTGSRSGRAVRASTTSPSCSTTPSASGERSGAGLPPPSRARSLGRTERARSTRPTSRQVTSPA